MQYKLLSINGDTKMLKAFIVDDEKKICLLLQNLIDWNQLGIQIVGVFNNGLDAYNNALEKSPDIIITDIRMPDIDGLELIRKIRENGIPSHFILISGYKEFKYAKTAMQYGVMNYLLKPINKDDLTRSLQSICKLIEEDNTVTQQKESLAISLKISAPKVRHQFFSEMYKENHDLPCCIERINSEYLFHFSEGLFRIVLIRCDLDDFLDMFRFKRNTLTYRNHFHALF